MKPFRSPGFLAALLPLPAFSFLDDATAMWDGICDPNASGLCEPGNNWSTNARCSDNLYA